MVAIPPDMTMQQGYVQPGMKPRQGKGNRHKNDGSQVWGRQGQDRQTEHRDPPKRTRDGQLSRLKDEDITHLEPPWENVTTVMMRNLPNKYTQQMLLGELRDAGFHMQEDFDFFYLPMDHCNCANLGYCFINFTKTARANDFAGAFSGKRMRRFNSHKTAVIMPASIQGYEQNYTYYISTRVAQAADPQHGYRPLFLRPLPSVDVNLAATPSGKAWAGPRDRGKDRGGRGRRKGDWDLGGEAMLGGGDWNSKDEDSGRVIPPQIPAAPVQQDYQVMCANCGTLCGSSYRFCSFCGNPLWDAAGLGGPVMMAAYFQPEWQMMPEQPQMSESAPVDDTPTLPSKSNGKKETNKMQQEETATEEPPSAYNDAFGRTEGCGLEVAIFGSDLERGSIGTAQGLNSSPLRTAWLCIWVRMWGCMLPCCKEDFLELGEFGKDPESLRGHLDLVAISNPALLDPGLCPPGKLILHLYGAGNEPFDIWQDTQAQGREAYEALKEERSKRLWEALEARQIERPDLGEHEVSQRPELTLEAAIEAGEELAELAASSEEEEEEDDELLPESPVAAASPKAAAVPGASSPAASRMSSSAGEGDVVARLKAKLENPFVPAVEDFATYSARVQRIGEALEQLGAPIPEGEMEMMLFRAEVSGELEGASDPLRHLKVRFGEELAVGRRLSVLIRMIQEKGGKLSSRADKLFSIVLKSRLPCWESIGEKRPSALWVMAVEPPVRRLALVLKKQTELLQLALEKKPPKRSTIQVTAKVQWPVLDDDCTDFRDVGHGDLGHLEGVPDRLKSYELIYKRHLNDGTLKRDPGAVYAAVKQKHLPFAETREEKELRVLDEWERLQKGRLSAHQWEVLWEEKLGEREAVGLGMTARENLIQYLRKIGDQLSREVRKDKLYREGAAGAREFRGVATWEEAHEVVKEFEAMNAGQRALQNSSLSVGGPQAGVKPNSVEFPIAALERWAVPEVVNGLAKDSPLPLKGGVVLRVCLNDKRGHKSKDILVRAKVLGRGTSTWYGLILGGRALDSSDRGGLGFHPGATAHVLEGVDIHLPRMEETESFSPLPPPPLPTLPLANFCNQQPGSMTVVLQGSPAPKRKVPDPENLALSIDVIREAIRGELKDAMADLKQEMWGMSKRVDQVEGQVTKQIQQTINISTK
eukprot:s2522_g7.t1